jgi:dihydrofolate reductase
MRRIVAYLAASVDGFIAGPGDDMEWLPRFDGDATGFHDFFAEVQAIAMGRRTYEWILAHSAWPYGEVPSWVMSRSLRSGPAEHVTVTPGPADALAAELRQGEGVAWLVGGGRLFRSFAEEGLVDEWVVTTIPVLLGGGVPLLGSGAAPTVTRTSLTLLETRELPGGLLQSRFAATG